MIASCSVWAARNAEQKLVRVLYYDNQFAFVQEMTRLEASSTVNDVVLAATIHKALRRDLSPYCSMPCKRESTHSKSTPICVGQENAQNGKVHIWSTKMNGVRQIEHRAILTFIDVCKASSNGGALYAYGAPGVGKTHTISDCLSQIDRSINPVVVMNAINEFSFRRREANKSRRSKNLSALLARAVRRCTGEKPWKRAGDNMQKWRKDRPYISTVVLVIEEAEGLFEKAQTRVIYQLLELVQSCNICLLMTGNTNVDLLPVDSRIASRLQRCLYFATFTACEIAKVLKATHLPSPKHDNERLVIAKKIANSSGDMRHALKMACNYKNNVHLEVAETATAAAQCKWCTFFLQTTVYTKLARAIAAEMKFCKANVVKVQQCLARFSTGDSFSCSQFELRQILRMWHNAGCVVLHDAAVRQSATVSFSEFGDWQFIVHTLLRF